MYLESRHLQDCSTRLCRLRVDGLAPASKYWTYRSHAGKMSPISLVAYHQQRVSLPPLPQWLAQELWIVSEPFSQEQWLCLLLLTTSWKVAMRWSREIRMIWDHRRTECEMCVTCWSGYPCMVYIDSNRHDSQIWVTACLWQSTRS
jgi:hypothetical protein